MDSSILFARRVDSIFSEADVRSVDSSEVEAMGWFRLEPYEVFPFFPNRRYDWPPLRGGMVRCERRVVGQCELGVI
jgi:hypothetical protein